MMGMCMPICVGARRGRTALEDGRYRNYFKHATTSRRNCRPDILDASAPSDSVLHRIGQLTPSALMLTLRHAPAVAA